MGAHITKPRNRYRTICISDTTLRGLKALKVKLGVKTYEDLIDLLARCSPAKREWNDIVHPYRSVWAAFKAANFKDRKFDMDRLSEGMTIAHAAPDLPGQQMLFADDGRAQDGND